MKLCLVLGLAVVSSFAFGAERYACLSKDVESGDSINADVSIDGASAELTISTQGLIVCRSRAALVVSGKKPVLTLTGPVACDEDEPEDMVLILNTAKKSLSFGDTDFKCK